MNRVTWCLVLVLGVSLGFNGWSYYKIDRLTSIVSIIDQKDKLQQQQMNDFTMIMYQKTNENVVEVARQNGKIEGMLAVMSGQKPDASETSQIWHAGYYRGLDQAKDMKESDGTIKVTDDKKK
jgi:hypothetical protein